MKFNHFVQNTTVHGTVIALDPAKPSFSVKARSGDIFEAVVGTTTWYEVLTNLDGLNRDRVKDPAETAAEPAATFDMRRNLAKYVEIGRPVTVTGLVYMNGGDVLYEAKSVRLMDSNPSRYLFEGTHWWITQVTQMADRILDHLFDARRNYTIDDFSKFYRTTLNILGQPTPETVQESAVLSRLIYDMSSAYLMTGAERYFLAARAAVAYMRQAFRSRSHDSEYIFWAYGRRRSLQGEKGEFLIVPSQNADDFGAIPLYEQIYALAGLAQYYRITLDWEVLEDIRRTINTFQDFFWDPPEAKEKGFAGTGGYYSHLDFSNMRPDSPALGDNRSRKNWNSVGDHIPAYLVNLILALDPLPQGVARPMLGKLLDKCWSILEETSALIMEKFPDPQSKFVNERFHDTWEADQSYKWQQNRAVVGHNLKIAWNLTRCGYYFQSRARQLRDSGKAGDAAGYDERCKRCFDLARRLGDDMADVGLDAVRGGVFDCVERMPTQMPIRLTWDATKDFWQQEQGILAYLILHGATSNDHKYLALARECSAFWNIFFLDRERQGYFFRTTEDGLPVIEGEYGRKGGHALGYHAFELCYLAHVYTRTFVAAGGGSDNGFCMYFKLVPSRDQTSINVLPDFLPPGKVEIARIHANGVDVTGERKPPPNFFQIDIAGLSASSADGTLELAVEFRGLAPAA